MICEKCGAVLPDDAAFCGKCGTKVNKNANGSKGKKSNKVKQTRPAPARKKAGFNIYKITTIILAAASRIWAAKKQESKINWRIPSTFWLRCTPTSSTKRRQKSSSTSQQMSALSKTS